MISNGKFNVFLFLSAVLIWAMRLGFRFAEYDTNIFCFGIASIISVSVSLSIALAWVKKREIVKASRLSVILFLITSSPLSLYVFLELFAQFVGIYELKH